MQDADLITYPVNFRKDYNVFLWKYCNIFL